MSTLLAHPRRCTRCFTLYAPHLVDRAFRAGGGEIHRSTRRRLICRPCEQTARDGKKRGNRWASKARDVVRRHVKRFRDAGKWHDIQTVDDLIRRYGWELDRLAHDAEFQYGNGCNYCGEQYREMGHGLADITLDVVDPDAPPYYRTNTKWCCMTCNRKKSGLSPNDFEADRQIYQAWSEQRARGFDPLTDDPDSLFHPSNALSLAI